MFTPRLPLLAGPPANGFATKIMRGPYGGYGEAMSAQVGRRDVSNGPMHSCG